MTEAILIMLGIGGLCGTVLSLASKIFYVYEDPRIAQVENRLAGANCGGCGFAGCSAAGTLWWPEKPPLGLCCIRSGRGCGSRCGHGHGGRHCRASEIPQYL
ncbi:MAG: hypothetical protein R2941_08315 [Desulfobacterales bacterium]